MPPMIEKSEMSSRINSREDKMVVEDLRHNIRNNIETLRPHNFTTEEGMFDNVKNSEISSQVIELIDANDSDLDKSEEHHDQVVKINPLF